MILIEVEGGTQRRFHLEFHPRLTIVADLSPDQRQELITTISVALHGGRMPGQFHLDVAGVPQLLTPQLMASIGMQQEPVDIVLQAADLPGASLIAGTSPFARTTDQAAETKALVGGAERRLEGLIEQREQVQQRLDDMAASHQQISLEATATDHDRLAAAVAQAEADLDGLHQRETPDALDARLRALRSSIKARIGVLTSQVGQPIVNTSEVEHALAALEHQSTAPPTPQVDLRSIAAELRALDAAIEARTNAPTAPTWLVTQLREELDAATAELARLEEDANTSAVQAGVLITARRRMEDAQVAWDEVAALDGADIPQLEDDYTRLLEIAAEALQLPVEEITMAHLEQPPSPAQADAAQDQLRRALQAAQVYHSPEDDLTEVAIRWLDRHAEAMHEREAQQDALSKATLDLVDVERQLADMPALRNAYAHEMQIAEAELDAARRALAALSHRHAQVQMETSARRQATEAELAALDNEIAKATADLRRLERLLTPPRADGSSALAGDLIAPTASPWWKQNRPLPGRSTPLQFGDVDVSMVRVEEVEYDVYGRGVTLRRGAFTESAPLIIDAAFDDLPIQDSLRLLHLLPRITGVVQIIYLATNDVAETWALRQSEFDVAVVRVEQASGA